MDYFVIGDIHACFFTFEKMLANWNSEKERLVCVGDYIDRGSHNAKVLNLCMSLQKDYPNAVFLKGNHEAEIIEHYHTGENKNWLKQGGSKTWNELKQSAIDLPAAIRWMTQLPLVYQNEYMLVSHAGISATQNPYDEKNSEGVLWNRQSLIDIGKLQIHGHTPTRHFGGLYHAASRSWNIDAGVYHGFGLSAIKVNESGLLIAQYSIPTEARDMSINPIQ